MRNGPSQSCFAYWNILWCWAAGMGRPQILLMSSSARTAWQQPAKLDNSKCHQFMVQTWLYPTSTLPPPRHTHTRTPGPAAMWRSCMQVIVGLLTAVRWIPWSKLLYYQCWCYSYYATIVFLYRKLKMSYPHPTSPYLITMFWWRFFFFFADSPFINYRYGRLPFTSR